MIIKNISKAQITMIGLINGRDLSINPGEQSDSIIPNKEMLGRLINKSEDLRLVVATSDELDMVSKLDARAINIIILETAV